MSQRADLAAAFAAPWRRAMSSRDPHEHERASTPLELLFDLCFVVAVAQAAVELAHGVETDHVLEATVDYLLVFFAIWWAWMNFTWFASAYDTDDVPYRLLTAVQMLGVLVLAGGVHAAFADGDYTAMTIGYVVMRLPMVVQWLRAAVEDPVRRGTALRYAGGIAAVQVLWVARLAVPSAWGYATFGVLVLAELAVPVWAERAEPTTWHPAHIAERYGLFTIIVLGEVILATTVALQSARSEGGLSVDLVLLGIGGLMLVLGVWWIYFLGEDWGRLTTSLRLAIGWGYGHYLVFASVAALGAGLEVAVVTSQHHAHISETVAGLAVAVPVAAYLVVLTVLRSLTWGSGRLSYGVVSLMVVLLVAVGASAGAVGLGPAVLLMGLVLGALLAVYLVRRHRRVLAEGHDA